MKIFDSSVIIIILCGIVILSYFFSLLSLKTRIPSVILLLVTGIVIKFIVSDLGIDYNFPTTVIELFGTVGLIMILLEAGLDLKISRKRIKLIRNSALSALIVMLLSVVLVSIIIKYWLNQPILNSIVYSIPLSIISGAIVIPSLGHLTFLKRDFLIYEASFSDIFGILIFNYIITEHAFSLFNFGIFFFNMLLAIIIALVISFSLFYLLTHSKVNVKFFLAFSILVLLYITGEMINLPSLIIILVFGLMVSNWEKIKYKSLTKYFPHSQIESTHELLHSITAESSFLIRTFFFILFGYSLNLKLLLNLEVLVIGSSLVVAMLLVRYFYLKLFVKENIFPELFFMPRGLITILLFYKIPSKLQLSEFNMGILFFVVLATSLIMLMGSIFYKTTKEINTPDELFEQG